jgi:hypothetical protein
MSSIPNQVFVEQDTANQVVIDEASPNQVIVRTVAYTSAATQRYTFTQQIAASTWVITHTLGGKPQVTIVDSADTVVIGDVTYNSNSQITVSFTSPFSGYAYLT